MATKKQNKKGSGNILFFLFVSLAVVLIILLMMSVLKDNGTNIQSNNDNQAPDLAVTDTVRSLEVLAINQGGYQARDVNTNEPVTVIVPESAAVMLLNGPIIKVGDMFVLQKYVVAANGLIARQLQVLPAPPTDKPTGKLPDNPE